MISRVKLYMLKLVPKLKRNNLSKLLLVDMKENNRDCKWQGSQNKQKYLIVVPRVRVENKIS